MLPVTTGDQGSGRANPHYPREVPLDPTPVVLATTRSVSTSSLVGFAVLVLLGYLLIVRRRRDDGGGGPAPPRRTEPTGRAAGTPDPNRWEAKPTPPPSEHRPSDPPEAR